MKKNVKHFCSKFGTSRSKTSNFAGPRVPIFYKNNAITRTMNTKYLISIVRKLVRAIQLRLKRRRILCIWLCKNNERVEFSCVWVKIFTALCWTDLTHSQRLFLYISHFHFPGVNFKLRIYYSDLEQQWGEFKDFLP